MEVDQVTYYRFCDFELDVESQELLKNGQHVQLTHKAFQILLLLVRNAGHITRKTDIFRELWADSFVEESNLTQHIHVLRKVLGQTPRGQSYVETIPRLGYRFTLQPEEISYISKGHGLKRGDRQPANLPYLSESGTNHGTVGAVIRSLIQGVNRIFALPDRLSRFAKYRDVPARERKGLGIRVLLVVIGMLFVLETIGMPAFYYLNRKTLQSSDAVAIRSIAVMPFRTIGEKVDKQKLGVGMADAVITSLSKIKQVSVRPTSAISRYTDSSSIDAVVVGESLGVDAVLEGMVQCDGEFLRVSVQLIRVTDGKPLWADSFHEKMADVFTMQDLVSTKVATAVSTSLTQQQMLARRSSPNAQTARPYQPAMSTE
jgi:DNA-binding winged helix-turn-helix (wHTH) protein/TolB-like protein